MKIINNHISSNQKLSQIAPNFGHKQQYAKQLSENGLRLISAAITASGLGIIAAKNRNKKCTLEDFEICKEVADAMSRFTPEELAEFSKSEYFENIQLLSTLNFISSTGSAESPRFNAEELLEFAKVENIYDFIVLANTVTPNSDGTYSTRYGIRDLREFVSRGTDFKLAAEYGAATVQTADNKLKAKYFLSSSSIVRHIDKYKSNSKQIEEELKNIDDLDLRGILEIQYERMQDLSIDQREVQQELFLKKIDAYYNLKNKYVTYKKTNSTRSPEWKKFYTYLDVNHSKIKNLDDKQYLLSEFLELQRVEALIEACNYARENKINDDALDYLYEDVYLNTIPYSTPLPAEIRNTLISLNREYGTKVFLPTSGIHQDKNRFIKRELDEWCRASNRTFTPPPVIDLLRTKVGYFNEKSAYGKSRCSGFCHSNGSKAIELNGYDVVDRVIRHELMHANDTKLLDKFPDDWYEPDGKTVKQETKNKFYNEFQKGCPARTNFEYAYNNPKEFIAVAAEGKMKNYSPEFINLLIEFGMPDWAVNLRPI